MAKHPDRPRIVIDSNVWISALIYGGRPGEVLKLFIDDKVIVVASEELLTEIRRKVSSKFPGYISSLSLLEASLRRDVLMVRLGSRTVAVSRDADDNAVLEAALLGGCSYIVSGDKDLLALGSYEGIQIVKPAHFLQL